MKSIPSIKAMMTPFPHWVGSDRPVSEAVRLMQEHGVHHLAVKSGDQLVGLITERDLDNVRNVKPETEDLRVAELGVSKAYVVGLSEPLDRVLRRMVEEPVDAALVVKDGKLAGIFTVTDACKHFHDLLRSLFPSGGDSAA